jgi:hypothetical protein
VVPGSIEKNSDSGLGGESRNETEGEASGYFLKPEPNDVLYGTENGSLVSGKILTTT